MDDSDASARIRELLEISEPTRSRSPKWLLARVKAAVKAGTIGPWTTSPTSGDAALQHVCDAFGDKWADHRGFVKWDGYELLVTEPYAAEMGTEMMDQLHAAMKVLQAAYLFSATSWHFPGRTMRIYVAESHDVMSRFRKSEHVRGMTKQRVY